MKTFSALVALGCAISVASLAVGQSSSAEASSFYQDKVLDVVVSSGVGGGTDTISRMVARYIGRHLPGNPTVVVRNMPGAGGLTASNYLYNLAKQDGTTIGMLDQSIYLSQLFKTQGVHFDVRKFNWLGRIITNNAVLVAWHAAAVKKIDDAYKTPLIVSATGLSSKIRWTMLKRLTGLKFKLISGFRGSAQAMLAMERGEVDAASAPWQVFRAEHAEWLRDKKVNVLLQTGLKRAADLPNVPRLVDLAKNGEQHQILELFSQPGRIGRSLVAPPGLPKQRVAELRSAVMATLKDHDFLAQAKSMRLTLEPATGQKLQSFIAKAFDYSPKLIAKAKALATLK